MQVVNIARPRPRLGLIQSPYTAMFIPTFPVTLTNRGRSKTISVGFDTGLEGAHLQIPSSLAASLGIVPTGSEGRRDATQDFVAQKGTIEQISVPGSPGCVLNNGKVLFFDDAPTLIGNSFVQDLGADISYASGSPTFTCNVKQKSEDKVSPIFNMALTQKGKTINATAFFDTGFEGSDLAVPYSIAQQLGLPALSTNVARTHTGTVTLIRSRMDRLALADLPACYVNGANVDILPANSPIQRLIVGEDFMKKIDGKIGYDQQGAYFSCNASKGAVARAVGEGIIPSDLIPEFLNEVNPWAVGGAIILGLGILGSIALFMSRD